MTQNKLLRYAMQQDLPVTVEVTGKITAIMEDCAWVHTGGRVITANHANISLPWNHICPVCHKEWLDTVCENGGTEEHVCEYCGAVLVIEETWVYKLTEIREKEATNDSRSDQG